MSLQANNLSPMGLGQPHKKNPVQQAILQKPQPPTQNGAPQPPMMEMPPPPPITAPPPVVGPTGNDIYERVQHAIFNRLPLTPPNPELTDAMSWMQSTLGQ